ncbi:MAG: hypothetical protein FVQ77_10785 [Cytophagales bacterium]|nr:hypothetical protein [Cytophagales bacterium]
MSSYKFFFAAIALSLFCLKALSQDVILLKDGSEIKSKVIEITEDVIKYKKFEHLDGPLISVSKNKVFMITYENGTKEVISSVESEPKEEIKPKEDTDQDKTVTVTYSKVGYTQAERDRNIQNLIKVNPLMILNGDIPIYIERRVSDHFAIEAGIGITQYDYIYYAFTVDTNFTQTKRTASIGLSFRASARFYPSTYTKALEDFYIGPEVRFRNYVTEVSCGSSSIFPNSESRTQIDFKITGGYIFYLADRVIIDTYGGIGLRSKNINRWDCKDPQGIAGPTNEIKKNVAPVIALGVKIGFGF